MDEILQELPIESCENLDRLDRGLVALEKDPQANETLASVRRTIPRCAAN
jgi:two-component system chemotaxis sensor kinase CheA